MAYPCIKIGNNAASYKVTWPTKYALPRYVGGTVGVTGLPAGFFAYDVVQPVKWGPPHGVIGICLS